MSRSADSRSETDGQAWESAAVATLHQLNAQSIHALAGADAGWYSAHLRNDFVCTDTDGQRIDKREFLRRVREQRRADAAVCDEIDVRILDDVALVHGVLHRRFE